MDTSGGQDSSARVVLRWVFNPFHYIAGGQAMLAGLAVIILTALLCLISGNHVDGVLDFHTGTGAPWWVYLVEGSIDWLVLAIPLWLAGKALSQSQVRAVDVLGTQALARLPYLVLAIVYAIPPVQSATNRVVAALMQSATAPTATSPFAGVTLLDQAIFLSSSMLVLAMLVWIVALMYRAFAVACNLRGVKAIATFAAILILAEVISKLILYRIYTAAGL